MTNTPTKVLIVEDEPVTRRGLQLFLQQLPGIDVVDIVDSGESAVTRAQELNPDVVLMDIGLPGMDGIATAKEIKSADAGKRVLMLTANSTNEAIFAAFNAGADGYVLKNSFAHSLELAIRTVRCGSVWLDPHIAQTILRMAVESPKASLKVDLSQTEQKVLKQLANTSCENGVCYVQPSFVADLRRFRPTANNGS